MIIVNNSNNNNNNNNSNINDNNNNNNDNAVLREGVGVGEDGYVYIYRVRSVLTARHQEIMFLLPLAARRPKLIVPRRLPAPTVWRAQLCPTASPEEVTGNIPGRGWSCASPAARDRNPQTKNRVESEFLVYSPWTWEFQPLKS